MNDPRCYYAMLQNADENFGRILQYHYASLDTNNEAAKKAGGTNTAVTDTIMDRLKDFWQAVFVNRELSFAHFSPTAHRTDVAGHPAYPAKTMSDGERTCLYLAARVLTAEPGILMIDEPELHMLVLMWVTHEHRSRTYPYPTNSGMTFSEKISNCRWTTDSGEKPCSIHQTR